MTDNEQLLVPVSFGHLGVDPNQHSALCLFAKTEHSDSSIGFVASHEPVMFPRYYIPGHYHSLAIDCF